MRLRSAVVVAAVVSVVIGTVPGFAAGFAPGAHGMGGQWAILRSVGLTDAQKEQVRQIFASHRAQLTTLRQQLRAAQRELGDKLYSATPPTAADLAPITQLRDQLAQQRLQIALEVRNVLTPDQVARAAQVRQQLAQLRSQMRALTRPAP